MKGLGRTYLGGIGLLVALFPGWIAVASGQPLIVDRGQGNAEIVTAADSPRMTRLASEELQTYLRKISGAELPIVTAPTGASPVKIYVGTNEFTRRLGVCVDGLKSDAFKIVAGDDWLALVGVDEDFVPPEPWARGHGDLERMVAEWDRLTADRTDAAWVCPMGGLYRAHNGGSGLWAHDRRGSLNAVYQFLRDLGVRWYMPGELGEVVPAMETIPLPVESKTVRPAYALRKMAFGLFSSCGCDDYIWPLRLGLNEGSDIVGLRGGYAHGLREVMGRPEMKLKHPDYYAVWNGARVGKPCLSSEGLVREAANYARAMFDIYDAPMVSVMPQDGYAKACECERCRTAGLETPERGFQGRISDYVWDFVNRVGQDLYTTHPNKKISCFAYGGYLLPPERIDTLSPNIVVGIVHGRKGSFRDPAVRARIGEVRARWAALSAYPLMMWEHYPFTHRGTFVPAYFPHQIAGGLRELQGLSMGEFIELPTGPFEERGHGLHRPGVNHLNVYVTARYYWHPEQDIEALLDEYCTGFYGPAADEMKKFIAYSEQNWQDMANDEERIGTCLELFDAARQKVDPASVYGRRVALVDAYLAQLRNLHRLMAKGRDNAPEVSLRYFKTLDCTIDGALDDPLGPLPVTWYNVRELETGRTPVYRTRFRMAWGHDELYVGIRCEERDTGALNAPSGEGDDPRILEGDCVQVLIETQSHAYYQIAVAPNGAVFDADRRGEVVNADWDSGTEVATEIGEDYWAVEMRIPVSIGDAAGDPLHDVVGRRPLPTFPWYVNVCRQRPRAKETERSAFSPTGRASFYEPAKFGRMPPDDR